MKHPMSFGEFEKEVAGRWAGAELFGIWLLYCAAYLNQQQRTGE